MITLYEETCRLCLDSESISELEYVFEGEVESGELPVPTFISSKKTAKKWFQQGGWQYYQTYCFCKTCFSQLENGYVVMDKYNQLYDDQFMYDLPNEKCVMDKPLASKMTNNIYNGEEVFIRKALPIVCKFLRGELEFDVEGYMKEKPRNIDKIYLGKNFDIK